MHNWSRTTLGKHIDLSTGFPFKSKHYTDSEQSIRLLRGDNVIQNSTRWENVKKWPLEMANGLEEYLLELGDLVIAMDRTWVKAGLKITVISENDLPSLLVQRVARLRGKKGLSQRYLPYIVNSHKFEQYVKSVQTETAVPHISARQLREFPILLPPIAEQKRIVEILEVWDGAIAIVEQLITAKQKLKESLLCFFISKDFLKEFREKKLSELSSKKISYGIVQTGEPIEKGIPCVRVVDLTPDHIDVSRMITTSNEINQSYKRTILEKDEIMVALRGEIGLVRIVESDLVRCNLTRGVARISPKKDFVYPRYLLWALRSPMCRNNLIRRVNGSALKEISIAELRKVVIPIPSISQQKTISETLDAVESEIKALSRQLILFQRQKQGLMQKLLTGEWRVPVEVEVAA